MTKKIKNPISKEQKTSAANRLAQLEKESSLYTERFKIVVQNLENYKKAFEAINSRLVAADMATYILLEKLEEVGLFSLDEFEKRSTLHYQMMQVFSILTKDFLSKSTNPEIAQSIYEKMMELKIPKEGFVFRQDYLKNLIKDDAVRSAVIINVTTLLTQKVTEDVPA